MNTGRQAMRQDELSANGHESSTFIRIERSADFLFVFRSELGNLLPNSLALCSQRKLVIAPVGCASLTMHKIHPFQFIDEDYDPAG
jgi:hypothetical protein